MLRLLKGVCPIGFQISFADRLRRHDLNVFTKQYFTTGTGVENDVECLKHKYDTFYCLCKLAINVIHVLSTINQYQVHYLTR